MRGMAATASRASTKLAADAGRLDGSAELGDLGAGGEDAIAAGDHDGARADRRCSPSATARSWASRAADSALTLGWFSVITATPSSRRSSSTSCSGAVASPEPVRQPWRPNLPPRPGSSRTDVPDDRGWPTPCRPASIGLPLAERPSLRRRRAVATSANRPPTVGHATDPQGAPPCSRNSRSSSPGATSLDLAVAVVIGAAFTLVVNSLVNDVLMQIIAAIVGKPDFSDAHLQARQRRVIHYGNFLTALDQLPDRRRRRVRRSSRPSRRCRSCASRASSRRPRPPRSSC